MGKIIKEMVGIEPVTFFSDAEVQKAVSTESKIFSIYADGSVPGYRRVTRVRVHAVVDFRNAPPPAFGFAGIPLAGSAAPGSSAPPGLTGASAVPTGTSAVGSLPNSNGAPTPESIAGALAPNPGGTIIYYRAE